MKPVVTAIPFLLLVQLLLYPRMYPLISIHQMACQNPWYPNSKSFSHVNVLAIR